MNGVTQGINDGTIDSAVILAAGLGTRMRPLTDSKPKPLVEVGGKTLIDWNLDRLEEAAITRIAVNVHYLADQLEAHVKQRPGFEVAISDERTQILNSGGGIKKAMTLIDRRPFFSLNADTIWMDGPRSNLERMREAFDPARMDVLLLVASTTTTIGWGNRGDFSMAQDGRLNWPKPGEVTPFAYCGACILQPHLFDDTPEAFSLLNVFRNASTAGRLHGIRLDGVFMHVGTPAAVREAEEALAEVSR